MSNKKNNAYSYLLVLVHRPFSTAVSPILSQSLAAAIRHTTSKYYSTLGTRTDWVVCILEIVGHIVRKYAVSIDPTDSLDHRPLGARSPSEPPIAGWYCASVRASLPPTPEDTAHRRIAGTNQHPDERWPQSRSSTSHGACGGWHRAGKCERNSPK